MNHLGDITKIKYPPNVDVVIGGSPCQDLSIAGKRAGLDGERSGLYMEQIRLIKEMRDNDRRNGRTGVNIRPRFMVWENVPGAFSSNKGEDFRVVLEEAAKVADSNAIIPRPADGKWTTAGLIMADGWSIAWRVLDAQFWGVPQRRRRISLVCDFGGQCAGEVLFVRKSVSGDTQSCGEKRKETSGNVERSVATNDRPSISFQERAGKPVGGGKGILIQDDHTGAISTVNNQYVVDKENPLIYMREYGVRVYEDGVSPTIESRIGTGGNNMPVVTQKVVDSAVFDARGNGDGKTVPTMTGDHQNRITDYTGVVVQKDVAYIDGWGCNMEKMFTDDKMNTIRSAQPQVVVQPYRKQGHPRNAEEGQGWEETDKTDTINVFDNSENRTPTVVVSSYQDKVGALCQDDYKGTNRQYVEQDKCVVQTVGLDTYNMPLTGDKAKTIASAAATDSNHLPCVVQNEVYCIGNGQVHDAATPSKDISKTLNCLVDPMKIVVKQKPIGIEVENEKTNSKGIKTLQVLWNDYGKEKIFKWGSAILERIKQNEVLQQGLHEEVIQGKTTQRNFLDDGSLPCEELVAEWILRDMWEQQKCGCSPQGRKSTEQRDRESNEIVPELSQQNTSSSKDLFNMWSKGQGIWILRQALSEIQKIGKSINGKDWGIRYIVRRLTPLEAERLQGYPDGWTDIGDYVDTKGKKCKTSDAARYKALGNSIALPQWKWVLKRLCACYERDATMSSCFDGIGGFPYIWEQINGKGSCLWASEIEEFPIAVTERRINGKA